MSTPRRRPSDLSSNEANEVVRNLLDSQHSQSYMIYSVEQFSNDELSYQQDLYQYRV